MEPRIGRGRNDATVTPGGVRRHAQGVQGDRSLEVAGDADPLGLASSWKAAGNGRDTVHTGPSQAIVMTPGEDAGISPLARRPSGAESDLVFQGNGQPEVDLMPPAARFSGADGKQPTGVGRLVAASDAPIELRASRREAVDGSGNRTG